MIGLMIAGVAGIFGGIMVMILGSLPVGVVLLLAGVVVFVVGTAKMLRAYGYRGEGAYMDLPNGTGRQQSELVKNDLPAKGEQPANIWDKVEKK